MDLGSRKSWHMETAEVIKQKPNLMPSDLFFEFRRHQPYMFKKLPDKKPPPPDKPPIHHLRVDKNYRIRSSSSKLSLRPSSQCSIHKPNDILDLPPKTRSQISSSLLQKSNEIEKTSQSILGQIDSILEKENLRSYLTPTLFSNLEQSEALKEYKNISHKISVINRGRLPLKTLKADKYQKDF